MISYGMMKLNSEKPEGMPTAYYRCVGLEDFVKKVEAKAQILGLEIDGNNVGFVMNPKTETATESDSK